MPDKTPDATSDATPEAPIRLLLHGAARWQVPGQPATPLERKQAAHDGARANLTQCVARLRRLPGELLSESGVLLALAGSVRVEADAAPAERLLGAFGAPGR